MKIALIKDGITPNYPFGEAGQAVQVLRDGTIPGQVVVKLLAPMKDQFTGAYSIRASKLKEM